MAHTKVASRYAKAFLELVTEKNRVEEAVKDMQLVLGTIRDSHELALLLKSPIVKTDQKSRILESIYAKHIGEASMMFIKLITGHRRENVLEQIVESFIAQYKTLKGITTAEVTSATVLSDEAKKRITEIVHQQTGGTVELTTRLNPELIGGFVLRIGDLQLDTSISAQINALKQEFGKSFY